MKIDSEEFMSNKQITIKYIKTLNPCVDGWKNLIRNYPKCNMKMSKFLELEKIPYEDKLWLIRRVVKLDTLRQWAVECVENVMHTYNNENPNDTRVIDCIEVTKKYLAGESSKKELEASIACIDAAYAAAGAYTAAADAAYAAAYAAHAAYAAAKAAANATAYTADCYAPKEEQECINLSLLAELIRNENIDPQGM